MIGSNAWGAYLLLVAHGSALTGEAALNRERALFFDNWTVIVKCTICKRVVSTTVTTVRYCTSMSSMSLSWIR